MKALEISVLALLVTLFLQGCRGDANAEQPAHEPENTILYDSSLYFYEYSGKRAVVLLNQKEYEAELLKRNIENPAPINFNKYSVLLLDMGSRPTSGYSLHVSSIIEHNEYILVSVILNKPGTSCGVTRGATHPYKFIQIKSKKEILISEDFITEECS